MKAVSERAIRASFVNCSKASPAGCEGNSVGVYPCSDLACSLYVRGVKRPEPGGRLEETLTVEEQIERARARLGGFLDQALAAWTRVPPTKV